MKPKTTGDMQGTQESGNEDRGAEKKAKKRYKCAHCRQTFGSPLELARHVRHLPGRKKKPKAAKSRSKPAGSVEEILDAKPAKSAAAAATPTPKKRRKGERLAEGREVACPRCKTKWFARVKRTACRKCYLRVEVRGDEVVALVERPLKQRPVRLKRPKSVDVVARVKPRTERARLLPQVLDVPEGTGREWLEAAMGVARADIEALARKTHEHGREALSDYGWLGLTMRLNDAWRRLGAALKHHLARSEPLGVPEEEVDQALEEVAVYALAARMVRGGNWHV